MTEHTPEQTDGQEVERIGLVSDIHANAVAFEAVLEAMPDVDALIHAGDVIGYGPSPNRCIELLRTHDAYSVRGNHDEGLFGGRVYESGDEYAVETVTDANRAWLEACPAELSVANGQVKVVHGNPEDRLRYTYPRDFQPDLLGDEELLVLGHTHYQEKSVFDDGKIVNPGSVGQPRDGNPDAAFAVVDLDGMEVTLQRVTYDIDTVQQRIEEAPIGEYNARRLEKGT